MDQSFIGLPGCVAYEYRYTYANMSYYSPPTSRKWNFTKFVEVTGQWRYDGDGHFDCHGSSLRGDYGIGCSNGLASKYKVMPTNLSIADLVSGTGEVCQEKPDIWKQGCTKASFSFRCREKGAFLCL